MLFYFFFFSSRRRHTRYIGDWSSDVCSSDLERGYDPLSHRLPHRESSRKGVRPLLDLHYNRTMVGSERVRSEERRVGKECRSRWSAGKKKKTREDREGRPSDEQVEA